MKHGKKPTIAQRKMMQTFGLNSENWLVVKDTPEQLVLVHRHSDTTVRIIPKGEKQ